MKKERNSNFELLRIIAMLMIIVFHIWCNVISSQLGGDVTYFNQPIIYKRLFILDLISPLGQIANAVFILISGYFMVNKENINIVKISKKLFAQIAFSFLLLMFVPVIIYKIFDRITIKMISSNFINDSSWFLGFYFIIILSAYLFLNKYLNKMDFKKYTNFLVVLFALIQLKFPIGILNSISRGICIYAAGIFLFSLGGYIKKYDPFKEAKNIFFILMLIIIFVLIITSGYNIRSTDIQLYDPSTTFIQNVEWFEIYNFIPLISSICIFELFKRLKIRKNKVINYIGGSTLMIYLLHENDFVHSLWSSVNWIELLSNNTSSFVYNYIIWSLGTFEVCLLFYVIYDYIKNKAIIILKKLFINYQSDKKVKHFKEV